VERVPRDRRDARPPRAVREAAIVVRPVAPIRRSARGSGARAAGPRAMAGRERGHPLVRDLAGRSDGRTSRADPASGRAALSSSVAIGHTNELCAQSNGITRKIRESERRRTLRLIGVFAGLLYLRPDVCTLFGSVRSPVQIRALRLKKPPKSGVSYRRVWCRSGGDWAVTSLLTRNVGALAPEIPAIASLLTRTPHRQRRCGPRFASRLRRTSTASRLRHGGRPSRGVEARRVLPARVTGTLRLAIREREVAGNERSRRPPAHMVEPAATARCN
jgi:hypothetical protein